MLNTFDTLVVGLGGWGSAALYHLAKRGQKVCGVEQYGSGHDRGSSHGDSRIIRMAYFLHPAYVPVLRRAYELWRELEERSGEALMTQTGLLCFGEPGGELPTGLARCYAEHELPHERWSAAEARSHFPQFRLPEETECYWDPLGGFLRPEACLHAHIQEAQLCGASLLHGEPVLALEHEPGGVTLRTARRTLRAARAILATGAFTNNLLAGTGHAPIRAVRKVLFWYGMRDAAEFVAERFPCWIGERGGREFYGFPSLDRHELKAAEDSGGQPLEDPARVKRDLLPEDEAYLRPFADELFPGQLRERQRHKTCLYEETVDRHPIVDRHPQWENVVVAAGGSGHGYKFCTAIGEMAAQLAIDGESPLRPEIFAGRGRM